MSNLGTASLLAAAVGIASGYQRPPRRQQNPDNHGPNKAKKSKRKQQRASRRINRRK